MWLRPFLNRVREGRNDKRYLIQEAGCWLFHLIPPEQKVLPSIKPQVTRNRYPSVKEPALKIMLYLVLSFVVSLALSKEALAVDKEKAFSKPLSTWPRRPPSRIPGFRPFPDKSLKIYQSKSRP